jgi:transcriptional regulator with XRE-family HTH domain
MSPHARNRTYPFPASAVEQAIQSGLRTIQEHAEVLRSEVKTDRPHIASVARAAEEFGRSSAQLEGRYRQLERGSPYRAAISEALELALEAWQEAEGRGPDLSDAVSLDQELAALIVAAGREEVSGLLAEARRQFGLSLRRLADSTELAVGYVSELEGAQTGLPSEEVCEALDRHLDLRLRLFVGEVRRWAAALKEKGEKRRARRMRATARAVTLAPRENARLEVIVRELVEDPTFLQLVEAVGRLRPEARRLVATIAKTLNDELPPISK